MSLGGSVSERARRVWDEWNIRVAVLGSLFFQIVLTLLSNSRRRSRSRLTTAIIWACYLLADWIAAFAVGLISSGQTDEQESVNKKLAAFWAPFLLLHLGGPDAITAFSLEDNELWIRHLMGLFFQLGAVVYVFFQSLSNEYWIPIVLIFSAGACRYAERTLSLYRACLGNFKRSLLLAPNPGPNYAQLMDELSTLEAYGVPFRIDVEDKAEAESATGGAYGGPPVVPAKLDHTETVLRGYRFFETFKGAIVDKIFSMDDRDESRSFFLRTDAADAFKVMEVELNFIYDILYTKVALVHCKFGYMCRFACTALILASFLMFASLPKHGILVFDKIVSYILLVGAIALDALGLLMLLFSDWTVVSVRRGVSQFLNAVPLVGKRKTRWSEAVPRYSFITFCLNRKRYKWCNRIANLFHNNDAMDEYLHVKKEACEEGLKTLIFDELKAKAAKAHTPEIAKELMMSSARGAFLYSDGPLKPSIQRSLSNAVEYDEALLLWHIATELCYFTRSEPNKNKQDDKAKEGRRDDKSKEGRIVKYYNLIRHKIASNRKLSSPGPRDEKSKEDRINNCKLLSDYMLYLLIRRPTLMSTVVGIAQIRFQDTCEETRVFLDRLEWEKTVDNQQKNTCEKLLEVKTHAKLDEVKGNSSKTLLFSACMLANDIKSQWEDENQRWEMMTKVWVELLSYGASRCKASDHARELSQGGELITFVWLLMLHLGLGDNFKIGALGRAKLIVEK